MLMDKYRESIHEIRIAYYVDLMFKHKQHANMHTI